MDTLFLNIDGVLNNSTWFKSKAKNEKCLASEKKYKCIMEAYTHSGFEEISVIYTIMILAFLMKE